MRDGTEMGYTLTGFRKIHTGYYDFNSLNDLLPNGEKATVLTIQSTNTEAEWFSGGITDIIPTGNPDGIPDNASSEFFDYAEFKAVAPMAQFIADADPPTNEDELNTKTTNPNKRDTDGDFVPDGTFYIPFAGSAKRYKGEDRDNDGRNTQIFNTNYPPDINISETDPRNKESVPTDCLEDTDGDGLADEIELFIGSDIYDKDTDDDGLLDGDEYYGKGQNERWFGVKTDPCNPDTDRDGLPDGLELGITEKIYDFDPIIPDVGLFGGTAYDQNSEDDKYFFYTQAPFGETRKIRRFIADGDPDSRSDPANRDTNRDGDLDSESDMNCDGVIDNGKIDPALGLFVHPNEPWNYDEEGTLYLPVMPTEGPFTISPLGNGKYCTNKLDVYLKSEEEGTFISSCPSIVSVNEISVNNLPPNVHAFEIETHGSSDQSISLSHNNNPEIPVPHQLIVQPRYGGVWPPLSYYSNDPYKPGPDIDHIEPWINVDIGSLMLGACEFFGDFDDNIILKDRTIRNYIKISAWNWNLDPRFLAAIILRECVDVRVQGLGKILAESQSILIHGSYGPAQVESGFGQDLLWERFGIYRDRQKGEYRSGTNQDASWRHYFDPNGLYKPVDIRFKYGIENLGFDEPEKRKYRLRWNKVTLHNIENNSDKYTYCDFYYRNDIGGEEPYCLFINPGLLRGNLKQNYAFNVELAAQQIRRTASSTSKYEYDIWKCPYPFQSSYNYDWKWSGSLIPPSLQLYYGGLTIVPSLDLRSFEWDGSQWDYSNPSLFLAWEVLYDYGKYEGLESDFFRFYHNGTPSLYDCYMQICNKWRVKP